MKKIIIVTSVLLILLVTGCNQSKTEGEIDYVKYKETTEITNYAKIEMVDGNIMILELYPDIAPITVANFQKLISEKFYDGLTFHRIRAGFMIQGGDPSGNGTGGSKETIKGEFKSNGVENNLSHKRGIISMARSEDKNSASSQFFICHDDATYLDNDYAAFGKLIAGFNTLDKIANSPVNGEKPTTPIRMKNIRFVTIQKNSK